jgi:hypothetical protein
VTKRSPAKHALIHLKTETDYWLSDLGSSNGTYLNGRRLEKPARLYERDEISVGPHRLTFRQPKGPHRAAVDATITEPTICEPCADRCLAAVGSTRVAHPGGTSLPPTECPRSWSIGRNSARLWWKATAAC